MQIATSKWTVYNVPLGYCDGSSQSRCNRAIGNRCLLANYNHYKAGILGHAKSGWLEMRIQIREGIILARFDWSVALHNGRRLRLEDLPSDFEFDFSLKIGSVISKFTKSREEFMEWGVALTSDLVVYPLLVDKKMSHEIDESETVSIGIKIYSSAGLDCKLLLTHIYYA
jgi:hypothetical protein